jgi:hypothetical protein
MSWKRYGGYGQFYSKVLSLHLPGECNLNWYIYQIPVEALPTCSVRWLIKWVNIHPQRDLRELIFQQNQTLQLSG